MEIAIKRERASWFNDEKPCQEAKQNDEGQWVVNVRSLEQLLDFADTYGGLRVLFDEHGWPVLEIMEE